MDAELGDSSNLLFSETSKTQGFSRRVVALALSVAAATSGTAAWIGGGRSLLSASTDAAVSFREYKDPSGRCMTAQGVNAGAQIMLGPCQNSALQSFQMVGNSMQFLANPQLCITKSGPQGGLVLDVCRMGDAAQSLKGNCVGGTAQAVAQACGGQTEQDSTNQPASRVQGGPTLFCFMVVVGGSYEEQLMHEAQQKGASIFGCHANKVYFGESVTETVHNDDGDFVVNDQVFGKIWDQVRADGLWKQFEWTVKADPDCVWFPQRLQQHLQKLGAIGNAQVYIENTPLSFHFLGPIEVISRYGVNSFFKSKCKNFGGGGEDAWVKGCLDEAGVSSRADFSMLNSNYNVEECSDQSIVAFHAFKTPEKWNACFDAAR